MTKNGNGSRQDSCDQISTNPNTLISPQERTRDLNDSFRRTGLGGTIVITRGIQALDDQLKRSILDIIKSMDEFTPDNDPYGTHDFGSVKVKEQVIFWKIDYYDSDIICGSPDPSDPDVTKRIMTIMLAEEY